jgi:hypothetical protein
MRRSTRAAHGHLQRPILERTRSQPLHRSPNARRLPCRVDQPANRATIPSMGTLAPQWSSLFLESLINLFRHECPGHGGNWCAKAILLIHGFHKLELPREHRRHHHPFDIGERIMLVCWRARKNDDHIADNSLEKAAPTWAGSSDFRKSEARRSSVICNVHAKPASQKSFNSAANSFPANEN